MLIGLVIVMGVIFIGYVGLGISLDYLIFVVFMVVFGGLFMVKILVFEIEIFLEFDLNVLLILIMEEKVVNVIEVVVNGVVIGFFIVVIVGVMLLVFVFFIVLFNGIVGGIGGLVGFFLLLLEFIFGYLFVFVCYIIGILWDEVIIVGNYLG